ncbi:myb-related protein B-like [Anneissia japonica]|uniref:myb-related protein B-like n=1 Tax=Anneissia japonica TaxID=1529436 RepID=UPI001425A47A|nr:myb-related protein B-like [Anneissia japonica]
MSQSRFSCGYDSDSSDDYGDYSDQDCSQGLFQGSRRFASRGKWTKEEDDKLRNAVEYHGCNDWKVIASYVDRNELQCIQRWQKVLNPDLVKGPWTKEEDDLVVRLVKEYGPKRWSLISKYLTGRTGKQCRERWHNHLNPNIKKSAWTVEEDRIIYEAHKRLGNKWAEIAKLLPGRTDNAIKNHWNSTMKRKAESKSNPYSPSNQLACGYRYGQASSVYPVYLSSSNAGISSAQQSQEGSSLRSILQTNMRRGTMPSTSSQLSGMMNVQESPMRWIVMDNEDTISPFRDIPEIADTNFLEQDPRLDDLSTFEMLNLLGEETRGVTPIKLTKLHQKGATGYRFDGHAIANLSKDTSGRLIPITSPVTSKYSTPPTILRKKRKRSHLDRSSRSSNSSLLKTPDIKQRCKDTSTPKTTPIKPLTFSPSQFFNLHSPIIGITPVKQQLTSTPISKIEPSTSVLSTPQFLTQTPSDKENFPDGFFRTPKIRRALLETPRTPTPLKDALAALEKKSGPIRKLPLTPDNLVEDISEIIKKDEELSGFKAMSSFKRKQTQIDTPVKTVRKTLSSQWADEKKNTDDYFFSMPGTAETPSSQFPNSDSNAIIRQLFRDSSTLLSDDTNMGSYSFPSLEHFGSEPAPLSHLLPPITNTNFGAVPYNTPDFDQMDSQSSSILAESSLLMSPEVPSKNSSDSFSVTLDQGFIVPAVQTNISKYRSNKSLRDLKRFNETPYKPSIKLNRAWEAVACGQTADQLLLIQQAKKYLFSSIKPRSLKL